MRLRILFGGLVLAIGLLSGLRTASAALAGLERVATGLAAPMFATHAPHDPTRLFIGQRDGTIRVLNLATKTLEPTPFLSIPNVAQGGEGGLLGMAFHPNYPEDPRIFVNVTLPNPTQEIFQNEISPFSTHIRSYSVSDDNPNVANATPTEVLRIVQPQSNHNAGWIGFSPVNDYLYIPMGDGGGGNDLDDDGDSDGHTPGIGNAQDITDNLLGKIVRIDVDGDDFPSDAGRNYAIPPTNPYVAVEGDDEIWASGLRNPFRNSFDRLTGDLWLGDVGQGVWEEIDRQPADAPPGENFGWRILEGNAGGPEPDDYRGPVHVYDHSGSGGRAVIGGYVYRGPDPSLQGDYFFGDNTSSHRWQMDTTTYQVTNIDGILSTQIGSVNSPSAYGEDAVGNLYLVSLTGNVYRLVTDELIAGDYNADGNVDDTDYEVWKADFGSSTNLAADGNKNNVVDAADYTVWRDNFGNSVHDLGGGGGAASVPEPTAAMLTLWAGATGLIRWRNRGWV